MSLSLLVGSCATMAPQNFSEYTEGEWAGKVLVRDKKESKSAILNVKVKAVNGERLRVDVTSTMGTHLASMLLVGQQFEYLDMVDRSVLKGKASRESLRSFLRLSLEPKHLYSIFFDKPIESKAWACAKDEAGLVKSCQEANSGLKIEWLSRDGKKRTVALENHNVSVQMSLFDFESRVKDPDKVFTLKTPSSFTTKKL